MPLPWIASSYYQGGFEVVPVLPMEGCRFPSEIMVIIIEFTEEFLRSSRNVCINQLAMLLRKRRPIVRSCIDERHQRLMRLEQKRTPVETIAVSWRPWFALEIYMAKLYATKWSLANARAAPTVKSLFRELVRGGHMSSTMAHPHSWQTAYRIPQCWNSLCLIGRHGRSSRLVS